ncbi:MAG TPA: hypothetical protein VG407_08305 [Caulobacteraceae bacterium]|jgi:hypothetical protein|nr:hypothetical protein [Caulobacteraceae bacterium]
MGQVHYEVFVRKAPMAPWRLELATEDRAQAMTLAEDIMEDKRAAAVRVTKETLDDETMEFRSVTLITRGAAEEPKTKPARDPAAGPTCNGPADLYLPPARETIQKVLDDWLRRQRVTPFELLHRPDLAEKLEAAGMEMQHAIQKVSVPESQITGQPVHEIIRSYQRLTEQAFERLIKAGRKGLFPEVTPQTIATVAEKLAGNPDRAFLLGGGVAAHIAPAATWSEKVDRLLDLVDGAPEELKSRALVHVVVEQPLSEIVASRAGLQDLIGGETLDLGGALAALVRIAAPSEVAALIRMEAGLVGQIPPLEGAAVRLGKHMDAGAFKVLGTVLARRVINELTGPRRLRPSDAKAEIDLLRALAMALTASAGRLLSLEEVQDAFVRRSKAIVNADFVEAYLGHDDAASVEAMALVKLCENLAGAANKRLGARWLMGCIEALRFETEFRKGSEPAMTRLASLAALQRAVFHADLPEKETRDITVKLGEIGGDVESDVRICAQLVKAPVGAVQKLSALLRLACGEAAPLGPAADRAKQEVLRLIRAPEVRKELAESPEAAAKVMPLVQQLMAAA